MFLCFIVCCEAELTLFSSSPPRETTTIEAPLSAKVRKIEVAESDKISEDHLVTILEAMKMEINVRAEPATVGGTVDKILIKQGDSVEAGKPMFLVRKKESVLRELVYIVLYSKLFILCFSLRYN